jgi:hypothetical protein
LDPRLNDRHGLSHCLKAMRGAWVVALPGLFNWELATVFGGTLMIRIGMRYRDVDVDCTAGDIDCNIRFFKSSRLVHWLRNITEFPPRIR